MSNATTPRDTIQSGIAAVPSLYSYPVKAGEKLIQGTMVFLKQGYLYGTPQGPFAVGIAQQEYDNTNGTDGAITATIVAGVFTFANAAGGSALAVTDVGMPCVASDNQTVGTFTAGGTIAGLVIDVSSAGVKVAVRPGAVAIAPAGFVSIDQLSVFKSTEQTGTGATQNIAHGLPDVPGLVIVYPTDTSPSTAGVYAMTEGTHTSTNVVVTVTSGKKFKVVAFL